MLTSLISGLRMPVPSVALRRSRSKAVALSARAPLPGPVAAPPRPAALPVSQPPRLPRRDDAQLFYALPGTRPELALTFDDGPDPELTPLLLHVLAHYRVRATFFVIGEKARAHPELLRRIVAEGHEIGNHSDSHPLMRPLHDAEVLRQIDRTQQVVWRATGVQPVTFRPPHGLLTRHQERLIPHNRNLAIAYWSHDPKDWRTPGMALVARRMIESAQPGAVILAHDTLADTMRAIPAALEGILAKGLEPVTLSELLGWPRWGGSSGASSPALGI